VNQKREKTAFEHNRQKKYYFFIDQHGCYGLVVFF